MLQKQHWAGDRPQGAFVIWGSFVRYVHVSLVYMTCIEVWPRPAHSLSWWIIAHIAELGSLYILLQLLSLMASYMLTSANVIRPKGNEHAMQLPMTVSSA